MGAIQAGSQFLADTLQNLLTGLGGRKDKGVGANFFLRLISDAELTAMYRGDWLARKIVDIVPGDMTREWRDWQADSDALEKIEALEKSPQINLCAKLDMGLKKARLYGGAALVMGMDDGAPGQELRLDRVKAGSLKYLHVLGKNEIAPGETERSPLSEYFGQPKVYRVEGADGTQVDVHPSRVVRLTGSPILDETAMATAQGWGDSILQVVYDAVSNAGSAQQHVAAMIPEALTEVVYVPGLSKMLENAQTTSRLTTRFTRAKEIKSLLGMTLLEGNGADGDQAQGEKWEQKQVSFAQLPELIQQFLQIASGAADIPVTRLLGESPAGMNATGESDLRNYYDHIAARQRVELSPALHRLDEVLIRSALGTRDPDIYYEWAPLWAMSEKEKAEVLKAKTSAARELVGNGQSPAIFPVEVVSRAFGNALVEDGSVPGLEAAIEEFGIGGGDPNEVSEGENPEGQADPALRRAANDAAPRTLYVRRDVVNAAAIRTWAEEQGLTDIVADMHVTLIYSRAPIDWIKAGNASEWRENTDGGLTIPAGGPRAVEPLGDSAAVLMFASSQLAWRHEEIVRAGASHDYAEYQPHISLTKTEADLSKVEPYRGPIILGPEIFAEIEPD